MIDEDSLTIKKSGKGFTTLCDTKNLSIKYNGKEMMDIQSIKITLELEDVLKAEVRILDANLDLENMPVKVEVNELHARILLKKILNTQGTKIDPVYAEQAREMTKGMPDIVDATTRDDEFRRLVKTDQGEENDD